MPFKSEKQRRWMYKNRPDLAKEWSDEEKRERSKPTKRKKTSK